MKKRTIIIGGGTFSPIRNHLSLASPAFGTTAKALHKLLPTSELILTKMADSNSPLLTNGHVAELLANLLDDETVGTIVMNVALCDYEPLDINNVPSGLYAQRLKTNDGNQTITLTPTAKIISCIRQERPDIFLVGFKTTTRADEQKQYYTALKFMKNTKCNLVLANDTITRKNMIVVPEEAYYHKTTDRTEVLQGLADLITLRQNLTYHVTNLHENTNHSMKDTPKSFQTIIQFLIDNAAFISDNGNGFTPGHFCYSLSPGVMLSSQRKANHNDVFTKGLTLVDYSAKSLPIQAYGDTKPSVGATSQALLLDKYPQYNCIIHTHNPLKPNSKIIRVNQYPYQCGSLECGNNTLQGLTLYEDETIAAVYLNKHGINIMFNSNTNPNIVINFIKNNLKLGIKVQ